MVSSSQIEPFQNALPRAAVSIVVRYTKGLDAGPSYLLVQRGKEPNKGIWSLPGGKIESGESSLLAAKRELREETGLCNSSLQEWKLNWFEEAPISSSDSIHVGEDSRIHFHYVISQWFTEIIPRDSFDCNDYPMVRASDDAADASWWSLSDVKKGIELGIVTSGVERVILRSELLYDKGLL
jgi:ADP-ribose pyrophosphatase YjhB (NUDIX family)